MDKIDIISMDVPLFIRMLEYAREDAKSDLDLHLLTENVLKAKRTLTMKDYEGLVPKIETMVAQRLKRVT